MVKAKVERKSKYLSRLRLYTNIPCALRWKCPQVVDDREVRILRKARVRFVFSLFWREGTRTALIFIPCGIILKNVVRDRGKH